MSWWFCIAASIWPVNLLAMFTRCYPVPDHSFFLLGPRGTGKSTWLRQVLPDALWFDLLRTHTLLGLTRQPESFRQQVAARPRGSWVVVDEVKHRRFHQAGSCRLGPGRTGPVCPSAYR